MPYGETHDRTEPDSIETLDLQPAYSHEWNEWEYVRIAVLPEDAAGPEGTCSFQLVQFSRAPITCKALQACLTISEIDMVIAGLTRAKTRMEMLNRREPIPGMHDEERGD